jgi:SAM-dependent methyltransferase
MIEHPVMISIAARWRCYEEVGLDETISDHDNMFDVRRRPHYFAVGRSAASIVAHAMMKVNIEKFSNVLDMPCGSGRVLRHLVRLLPDASFTASDIDREHVAFCARKFGATPIVASEKIENASFDGRFDLVWCGSLLTHLPQDRFIEALFAIAGWLAPGGIAIVTLHGRWSLHRQAKTPYKYLSDEMFSPIADAGARNGFGYADYPADQKIGNQTRYGISVSLPSWVMARVETMESVRLLDYIERGWDNHQDVLMLWKNPIAARPWLFDENMPAP